MVVLGVRSRLKGQSVLGAYSLPNRTVLPIRREWVMRAFYAHGLMTGTLVIVLGTIGARLTGTSFFSDISSLGQSSDDATVWLPWILMVPSWAGFLASTAAGNRRLAVLSLVSLVLTPFAFLYGSVFFLLRYGVLEDAFRIGAIIALGFALVGGVPSLIFLFPRKKASIRRP